MVKFFLLMVFSFIWSQDSLFIFVQYSLREGDFYNANHWLQYYLWKYKKDFPYEIAIKFGESFLSLSEYDKALYFFNVAKRKAQIQQHLLMSSYKIALTYFSQKNYILSLEELLLHDFGNNKDFEFKANLLKWANYWFIEDFEKSKEYYYKIKCPCNSTDSLIIEKKYKDIKKISRRRDEIFCVVVGGIFPGGCFLMNGNIKYGLKALATNLFFAWVILNTYNRWGAPLAGIVAFSWAYRYYIGTIKKSLFSLKEKRADKIYQTYVELLNGVLYKER